MHVCMCTVHACVCECMYQFMQADIHEGLLDAKLLQGSFCSVITKPQAEVLAGSSSLVESQHM